MALDQEPGFQVGPPGVHRSGGGGGRGRPDLPPHPAGELAAGGFRPGWLRAPLHRPAGV